MNFIENNGARTAEKVNLKQTISPLSLVSELPPQQVTIMNPVFHSNTKHSQDIAGELSTYLRLHVVDGESFVCRYAKDCKASSKAKHFYEGQAHHVGRHYDLTCQGRPSRIVVCGQENGGEAQHQSMDDRYRSIAVGSGEKSRFTATPGFRTRNPHMKGTTSLLRLWFGRGLGKDYRDEFIWVNDEKVHIFDAFSLVNFLMCTATDGGRRGKSTDAMQCHCGGHFKKIINILKPTLLVCQGDRVSQWVREACGVIRTGLQEGQIRISTFETRVLEFSHPAAWGEKNWGRNDRTPYLLERVAPAVSRVRHELLGIS
jgi:hypothetical protein